MRDCIYCIWVTPHYVHCLGHIGMARAEHCRLMRHRPSFSSAWLQRPFQRNQAVPIKRDDGLPSHISLNRAEPTGVGFVFLSTYSAVHVSYSIRSLLWLKQLFLLEIPNFENSDMTEIQRHDFRLCFSGKILYSYFTALLKPLRPQILVLASNQPTNQTKSRAWPL